MSVSRMIEKVTSGIEVGGAGNGFLCDGRPRCVPVWETAGECAADLPPVDTAPAPYPIFCGGADWKALGRWGWTDYGLKIDH